MHRFPLSDQLRRIAVHTRSLMQPFNHKSVAAGAFSFGVSHRGKISMLILIVRWRGACFGSFASLIFAEVTSAPASTLIMVISMLSVLVHVSWATDVCVTTFTCPCAATAVRKLVGKIHWLCHLDLGLLVDKVHRLCHLDLGLLVVDCDGLTPCSG